MKLEITCPQGRSRGTRVYVDGEEITHIKSLKLEIVANELPTIEIIKTVPDPSDPDEATGKVLLDPITKEPALETLRSEAEEIHFVGERFYRSPLSSKRQINLVQGVRMFAQDLDAEDLRSSEVTEITDNLYFFEEEGIEEIGGTSFYGHKYRVWLELPDDA